MKIEKIDVVCIAIGLFMLAAYLKIGVPAYLAAAVILIVPVVFFLVRGGIKLKVVEEKKPETHPQTS